MVVRVGGLDRDKQINIQYQTVINANEEKAS